MTFLSVGQKSFGETPASPKAGVKSMKISDSRQKDSRLSNKGKQQHNKQGQNVNPGTPEPQNP